MFFFFSPFSLGGRAVATAAIPAKNIRVLRTAEERVMSG